MRVADLLGILKITKQSLARVLKQLVDEGYHPEPLPEDRADRGPAEAEARGVLRISVGLEAVDDLIADIEQALK